MAFCIYCGFKLHENARFCADCGSPVCQPEPASPVASGSVSQEEIPIAPAAIPAEPEVSSAASPAPELPAFSPEPEPVSPYAPPPPQEPLCVPPTLDSELPAVPSEEPENLDPPQARKVPLFPRQPLSIPRRLTAGFLSLLVFLFSFSAMLLGTLRLATREDSVNSIVMDLSFSDIPAHSIIKNADEEQSLVQWLRGMLGQAFPWSLLTERNLEGYLDETVKPFLAREAVDLFRDLYRGRTRAAITEKEVKALLTDSFDYIARELGIDGIFSADGMMSWLSSLGLFQMADLEYLDGSFSGELTAFYWITSYYSIALLGVLAALMLFLLAVTAKSVIRTLSAAGGALAAAGSLPVIALFIAKVWPRVWTGICGDLYLVGVLSGELLAAGILIPLGMLGTGILLLLTRSLLARIQVKDV